MRKFTVFKIIVVLFCAGSLWNCASAPKQVQVASDDPVRLALQGRLTPTSQRDHSLIVLGNSLHAPHLIRKFYERRHFQPAWSRRHKPSRAARELVTALGEADSEGLNPDKYHRASISMAKNVVDMELLLTDAYILYVSDMAGLKQGARARKLMWQRHGKNQDAVALLEEGLASGRFARHLEGFSRKEAAYQRLKQALVRYRKIAAQGGWPYIPGGHPLQQGDQGERVALLNQRLKATGDGGGNGSYFDRQTDAGVRNFQRRHGLVVDGKVSKKTLAALNMPVERRIQQLKINMQRRRWLPDDLGRRHIVVNIPDYRLSFIDRDRPVLGMNVVVGKRVKTWRTPTLTSSVTHMILNPQWNVPPSIFKKELLRKIKKDPKYLARNNMKVVGTRSKNVIDSDSIDWEQVKGNEGIRIVQRSGRGNALGTMKFMFPNPYAIYMHDTRAKSLFKRHERAFSHGCIRVSEPLQLAEEIFRGDSAWSRQNITRAINSGQRQTVRLGEPVNVYIQYWTAWAEEDGDIQFREDIYGRDATLTDI